MSGSVTLMDGDRRCEYVVLGPTSDEPEQLDMLAELIIPRVILFPCFGGSLILDTTSTSAAPAIQWTAGYCLVDEEVTREQC